MRKVIAIINSRYLIPYPMTGPDGKEIPEACRKTLKACLTWDQDLRPTTETLLDQSNTFFYPDQIDDLKEVLSLQLLTVLIKHIIKHCETLGFPAQSGKGTT